MSLGLRVSAGSVYGTGYSAGCMGYRNFPAQEGVEEFPDHYLEVGN